MNSRRYALCLVLLVTAALAFAAFSTRLRFGAQTAEAQGGQRITVGVVEEPYPLSEGKAEGKGQPFNFNPNDVDIKTTLLSSPMPDVWLVFPPDPNQVQSPNMPEPARTVKVTLPPEALESMRGFWVLALNHFYRDEFEKYPDARSMQGEMARFYNAHRPAEKELEKFQITTLGGTRNITYREASELILYVNHSAHDLIKQAKEKINN